MAVYLTLEEAKSQLRVTDDAQNLYIQAKIDESEALVLERCNSTAYWRAITPTWTAITIPLSVKSTMLMVLTYLYEHRGDDMRLDAELWAAVDRKLAFNRDPVVA